MESQNSQSTGDLSSTFSKLGQVTALKLNSTTQIIYYKNPIILNQQYTHDIVPGVYEGGFQLWECEVQLLKKIFQSDHLKSLFPGKSVIQIGCGHGLLGIAAHKLNASQITLQDYNINVIQQLTKATVTINQINSKVEYLSGDWDEISSTEGYDVILGSEVTYREENYLKIINFIFNNMKKSGICILANKSYYFGVGGNLTEFKSLLQQRGLKWKSISKIVPKSGGNKKQIIQISFMSSE